METIRATNTHGSSRSSGTNSRNIQSRYSSFPYGLNILAEYPSMLEPVVPDDKVSVAVVDSGLHCPLPPLDVASTSHQRRHRPLSGRRLSFAVWPARNLTTRCPTSHPSSTCSSSSWGWWEVDHRGWSNRPNEGGSVGDEGSIATDAWRRVLGACVGGGGRVARASRLDRPRREVQRSWPLGLHGDPAVEG